MHDTCHAHVNSVTLNDMQAEDELEMKSSLWCQLTDLCEVGSWSSLQYLHSSRFLPEIPPPGTNVNTEGHCKETNKQTATCCSTSSTSKQLLCCAKPEDPTLLLHQHQPGSPLAPARLLSAFCPDTEVNVRALSASCSVMCLGQSHRVHHVTS